MFAVLIAANQSASLTLSAVLVSNSKNNYSSCCRVGTSFDPGTSLVNSAIQSKQREQNLKRFVLQYGTQTRL